MDEESLQNSIATYRQQLQQVETVLQSAGSEGQSDLLQLQKDLKEVIALTEESLLSLKKSKLLNLVDDVSQSGDHSSMPTSSQVSAAMETKQTDSSSASNMDDEFAAFQAALAGDLTEDAQSQQSIANSSSTRPGANLAKTTSSRTEVDGEALDQVKGDPEDIAGTQCSVYVTQEWGTRQCHNAIVLSVEPPESQEDEDDDEVRFQDNLMFLTGLERIQKT